MPVKMYKKFPTQPEDPRSAEYDFCLISHDIAFPKILLCSELNHIILKIKEKLLSASVKCSA